MNAISDAIAEGAMAYMKRQYMVVAAIGAAIAVILYFVFGPITAFGFLIGAVFPPSPASSEWVSGQK